MQFNILQMGVLLALGFIWFGVNLLTTRLIRRSDRATDEQKKMQIALTWIIPGFAFLADWMHRGFKKEEEKKNWAHPPTRSADTAYLGFEANFWGGDGGSPLSYASADHGCYGGDHGGDCGTGH